MDDNNRFELLNRVKELNVSHNYSNIVNLLIGQENLSEHLMRFYIVALLRLNRLDESEIQLEQFNLQFPESKYVHILQYELAFVQSNWQKAIIHLDHVIETSPNVFEYHFRYIKCLIADSQTEKANEKIGIVLHLDFGFNQKVKLAKFFLTHKTVSSFLVFVNSIPVLHKSYNLLNARVHRINKEFTKEYIYLKDELTNHQYSRNIHFLLIQNLVIQDANDILKNEIQRYLKGDILEAEIVKLLKLFDRLNRFDLIKEYLKHLPKSSQELVYFNFVISINEDDLVNAISAIDTLLELKDYNRDYFNPLFIKLCFYLKFKNNWLLLEKYSNKIIIIDPENIVFYPHLITAYKYLGLEKKSRNLLEYASHKFGFLNQAITKLYCSFLEETGLTEQSLDHMKKAFVSNKELYALPYMHQLLRRGNLTDFVNVYNKVSFNNYNKFQILESVFLLRFQLSDFMGLKLIIKKILDLKPFDVKQLPKFNYTKLRIIRLYNLLVSEEFDLRLNDFNNALYDLRIYLEDVIKGISTTNLIKDNLNRIKSKGKMESTILNLTFSYLDLLKDLDSGTQSFERPNQAFSIANNIKKRIESLQPTSFIRLGDGEGNFLPYPEFFETKKQMDQFQIQNIWWQNIESRDKIDSNYLENELKESIKNADYIGVIPEKRILGSILPYINQDGAWNHSSRGCLAVMDYILKNKKINNPNDIGELVSSNCHIDLEEFGLYRYMFENLDDIVLITCHTSLIKFVKKEFSFKKVDLLKIPPEFKYQSQFDSLNSHSHFDDYYQDVIENIYKDSYRRVYIVAAGFLGKIYCKHIKNAGGIGLDLGSIVDQWLGYDTRSFNDKVKPMMGLRLNHFKYKLNTEGDKTYTDNYCSQNIIRNFTNIDQTKVNIDFLICSHPRSGSGYVTKVFKKYDIQIGHEKMGSDGMSSWLHSAYDYNVPIFKRGEDIAPSRYILKPKYLIMLIRDPMLAIPSIMLENKNLMSFRYRRYHILKNFDIDIERYKSNFEKAVASYVYWNMLIQNQNPTYHIKLSILEKGVYKLLVGLGLCKKSYKESDKGFKYNSSEVKLGIVKPRINKSDFLNLNENLLQDLKLLCSRYKFDIFMTN